MSRRGFTLIEILIVVVIVGIIAAIGIPLFANTTAKSQIAAVKSDLHNLATAQESYFYEHATYAPSNALLNVPPSPGVTLTIVEATPAGWSATAVHPAAVPVTCAIYSGSATPVAPATQAGQIACR
jgi:prepilin-type N-terminal cleavage/methylation domain-containing protein